MSAVELSQLGWVIISVCNQASRVNSAWPSLRG